jgi:hypothetical protein
VRAERSPKRRPYAQTDYCSLIRSQSYTWALMANLDRETLAAALIGYEHQKAAIDIKIAQLKAHLSGHVAAAAPYAKKDRKKFSAETRTKMAAAQQRRWAAKHETEVPKATKKAAAKKKNPLSSEARQRISEAQRKRWAAAKKTAK